MTTTRLTQIPNTLLRTPHGVQTVLRACGKRNPTKPSPTTIATRRHGNKPRTDPIKQTSSPQPSTVPPIPVPLRKIAHHPRSSPQICYAGEISPKTMESDAGRAPRDDLRPAIVQCWLGVCGGRVEKGWRSWNCSCAMCKYGVVQYSTALHGTLSRTSVLHMYSALRTVRLNDYVSTERVSLLYGVVLRMYVYMVYPHGESLLLPSPSPPRYPTVKVTRKRHSGGAWLP